MTRKSNVPPAELELLAQVTGTPLDPSRLRDLLEACKPILDEIARLRDVDLADIHPAVIFDPTAPYRKVGR